MFKASALLATAFGFALAVSACNTDGIAGADAAASLNSRSGRDGASGGLGGSLRLRCELRSGRSKISVDGNNLRPLNAVFTARVQSGGNTASAAALQAVGDEVEFDFDSNANDIAEGATAIPATFIQVNASGPDVTAQILNVGGEVVVSASADCEVR